MDFPAVIGRIKQALTSRRYSSEADVREAVVLPVLRSLGWDDLDPDRVMRDYALGARRVDYALSAFGRQPALFIEVKGPGPLLGVERQLFEYAFHAGTQFAVLTNGQEWSFFLPAAPGSYEERLLYKLDLIEREVDEVVERLVRYLGFERVRSGDAPKDANRDYDDLHKERVVRHALPRAWEQILAEPDELLVELIVERTTSLAGYPASRELVAEFLAKITGAPLRKAISRPETSKLRLAAEATGRLTLARAKAIQLPEAEPRSSPASHSQAPSPTPTGSVDRPASSEGPFHFTFEGRELEARSATELLLRVVRTLADRQPSFLEQFAERARGRSRNHVARRREDVYPDRPDLIDRVIEIVPGWFIGTNISNRDKTRLLERACEAAGLRFGVDLVVDLPNAKT
jgi:hypothetical protein